MFRLQIQDVVGNDEVTLIRKFGNETWVENLCYLCIYLFVFSIRLMFSIADIQSAEDEPEYEPEEGESAEDQPPHSYPIRASFSITKVWIHKTYSYFC